MLTKKQHELLMFINQRIEQTGVIHPVDTTVDVLS